MGVDINAVKSILGINNLTLESPQEALQAALAAAHYRPEEIKMALELLRQPQDKKPSDNIVPAERKTKTFPGFGVEHIVRHVEVTKQKRSASGGIGLFAGIVLFIVVAVTIYHSGVLGYLAQATGMNEFCLGIADSIQTEECYGALAPKE